MRTKQTAAVLFLHTIGPCTGQLLITYDYLGPAQVLVWGDRLRLVPADFTLFIPFVINSATNTNISPKPANRQATRLPTRQATRLATRLAMTTSEQWRLSHPDYARCRRTNELSTDATVGNLSRDCMLPTALS
jgi:hypothetical protein